MTQSELHRALSRATGEPVNRLRRLGFSLVSSRGTLPDDDLAESAPQVVDWDEVQVRRTKAAAQG